MQFAKYWAKGTAESTDPNEREALFTRWRWSNQSLDDARQWAQDSAQQILQKFLAGEDFDTYGYGERPLREEMLQEYHDSQGTLIAALTRNSYGVLVLNTAQVMFIDIDKPHIAMGKQLGHFFSRLFGKREPSPAEQWELDFRSKLAAFVRAQPAWGCRLYRTAGGYRILVTHDLFDPASAATRDIMQQLEADPLYVRLCQDQECFRARLTPKPWRCEHTPNRIAWPHESEEQRREFDAWLSEYDHRQLKYATCQFLETLGNSTVHAQVLPVVELHDSLSRALEHHPLA